VRRSLLRHGVARVGGAVLPDRVVPAGAALPRSPGEHRVARRDPGVATRERRGAGGTAPHRRGEPRGGRARADRARPRLRGGSGRVTMPQTSGSEASFYEQVGGHDTFAELVRVFYREVALDPVLKPMYPEEDLG